MKKGWFGVMVLTAIAAGVSTYELLMHRHSKKYGYSESIIDHAWWL